MGFTLSQLGHARQGLRVLTGDLGCWQPRPRPTAQANKRASFSWAEMKGLCEAWKIYGQGLVTDTDRIYRSCGFGFDRVCRLSTRTLARSRDSSKVCERKKSSQEGRNRPYSNSQEQVTQHTNRNESYFPQAGGVVHSLTRLQTLWRF